MTGDVVDLAGTRVHVECWGKGPLLLCVHGLGGGGYFFAGLGQRLASRYRTLAIDLPGSGQSPPVPAFSFESMAAVAAALAAREGDGDVCLIGHSMGAIVALEAMRQSPHLATAFIAVGGLPEPLPDSRARIAARAAHVREHGLRGIGEQAVAANFSGRTRQERPEITALFARLFETQDPQAYAEAADALAGWNARPLPDLSRVACMTVTGSEDRYAPPDAVERFARSLPDGTALETLPGCGHLPFLEDPDAFTGSVRRFLERPRTAATV
jgi:pimeloyl-ACP methyl ester carboxylesterase